MKRMKRPKREIGSTLLMVRPYACQHSSRRTAPLHFSNRPQWIVYS
jgi:hypothetical protein